VSLNNVQQLDNGDITVDIATYDVLQCLDMDDYYALLYAVCVQSVTCSELYYLTQDADNATAVNQSP